MESRNDVGGEDGVFLASCETRREAFAKRVEVIGEMGEGCPFSDGFGGRVGHVIVAWFQGRVFGYSVAGLRRQGAN